MHPHEQAGIDIGGAHRGDAVPVEPDVRPRLDVEEVQRAPGGLVEEHSRIGGAPALVVPGRRRDDRRSGARRFHVGVAPGPGEHAGETAVLVLGHEAQRPVVPAEDHELATARAPDGSPEVGDRHTRPEAVHGLEHRRAPRHRSGL